MKVLRKPTILLAALLSVYLTHRETGRRLRMFRRDYTGGRTSEPPVGLGNYQGRWGYGHWHVEPAGEGRVRLISGNEKYCLGSRGPGGRLNLTHCFPGDPRQLWELEEGDGGGKRIRNLGSGTWLTLDREARPGRELSLGPERDGPAGVWDLEPGPPRRVRKPGRGERRSRPGR